MDCIIPGQNLKIFSKAFGCLAKIGDEIYMEASEDKLSFISMNISKTIYTKFTFLNSFFSTYEVETSEEELLTCKIFLKVVLPLFRGNLEKKLDFLKIQYGEDDDFIVFKMKYKNDQILMIHNLRLMETESLKSLTICNQASHLCASSLLFNHLFSMFNVTDNEVTLEISESNIVAKNYYPGAIASTKSMRCEVKFNKSDFMKYDIKQNMTLNFSLKPLRTLISFSEQFNLNVNIDFDSAGRPLFLTVKNPTFEASFIVATLNDSAAQISLAVSTVTSRSKKSSYITSQDRTALENVNWEEGFEESEKELPKKTNKKNHKEKSFTSIMSRVSKNTNRTSTENGSISNAHHSKIDNTELNMEQVENEEDEDIIPKSPISKRAKYVFGRCFESTFTSLTMSKQVCANSDSE